MKLSRVLEARKENVGSYDSNVTRTRKLSGIVSPAVIGRDADTKLSSSIQRGKHIGKSFERKS